MDFSETIEACDLKSGRCRQLIELMKVMEGQGHFLTLASGHLHIKIKTCFSKKNWWAILNQILYASFQVQGDENPLNMILVT